MENLFEKFWFRLVLVLLVGVYITELGSTDTMSTRLFTTDFYKEYMVTVLISLIVVELVSFINKILDRRFQWHGQVLYRLSLQIIFGWIVPLVIVFGMATLYFYANNVNILRTDYLFYAFPFVALLILFLNFIFVVTPYFLIGIRVLQGEQDTLQDDAVDIEAQASLPEEELKVKATHGTSTVLISTNQIQGAYIVAGKVLIRNIEGQELLADLTLDEIEKILPTGNFYRINRQLILNRMECKGYQSLDYSKLEVEVELNLPVDTIVSQRKAKDFKEWLERA